MSKAATPRAKLAGKSLVHVMSAHSPLSALLASA